MRGSRGGVYCYKATPSTSNIAREAGTVMRTVYPDSGIASSNVDAGEGGRDVVNSMNRMCVCLSVTRFTLSCRLGYTVCVCLYCIGHLLRLVM